MDKHIYIALENWENFNDCIDDVSETLQALSTKAFSTEILIQELARLVEQRLILWQQIEGFGFKNVWQAHEAFYQENERREHHELFKEA